MNSWLQTTAYRIAILVAFLFSVSGNAAELLPIKTYTSEDGLAHNRVQQIVRDSQGFLWFCTDNGLSRFDGQSFFTFGLEEGLAVSVFNDFLETRDGNYWAATNGSGVCRFNYSPAAKAGGPRPGEMGKRLFTVYRVGETGPSSRVNVLYEDRAGRIWAGTDGGLFVLGDRDSDAFLAVEMGITSLPDSLVQIWAIVEDREGSLWVGTKYGLVRCLPNGRRLHYRVRPTSKGTDVIHSLLIDREEKLWGGHEAGVYVLNPLGASEAGLTGRFPWRRLIESDAIHNPREADVRLPADRGEAVWFSITREADIGGVWSVREFSDGRVYMSSREKGLIQFDGRRFRTSTIVPGVGEFAKALGEDINGNIWIGLLHKGVAKIIKSGFITYTEADGLDANTIAQIFEDRAGQLYFLGTGWRLHLFVGERITSVRFNLPRHISDSDFASYHGVIKDHKGEWWVATREALYRFPKVNSLEELASVRPLAVYTTRDGLAGNDVKRPFEDSRGDIWIATFVADREVLTRWERTTGRFHRYSDRQGLPALNAVSAFCEDSSGSLWIGFREGGLARYREGRFTMFTPEDGIPERTVKAMHLDRAGRLWISASSERGGLWRVDDPIAARPHFKVYTTQDGLSSNIVGILTEDLQGRIYADTIKGLDRLDPKTGQITHYTTADGLAAETLTSAFGDRKGHVWFGTFGHGLSRITPGPERPTTPPPVFVSRLRIAGRDHPLSVFGESEVVGPELESDQNQIQIDYFGLSFASGGALDYRYKIEGLDHGWSAPTRQRTVNLSLSPGTYRFLVEAIASDGTRSPAPAEVSFTILSPVWQRWWFIALAVTLAVLLAFLFERYRVARLIELERVRTRIATDLHDDIGASLSRIAILSEVAKQQTETGHKQIAGTLTEVADSARGLVDSMSDIVWSIDPRKDNLKDVVQRVRRFASDVLEARRIEWELDVPPGMDNIKIPPEERRQLFLIFKEAINNVSRHSDCSLAQVRLSITDHRLAAEVSDDGRGFDPQELSLNSRGGNGLANMKKRAAEIGGEIHIDSAPGRGTHIRFTFPLRR